MVGDLNSGFKTFCTVEPLQYKLMVTEGLWTINSFGLHNILYFLQPNS